MMYAWFEQSETNGFNNTIVIVYGCYLKMHFVN